MLELELDNKINSWAIYWNYFVHVNDGLVLYPDKSLIENIGFGPESTHTKENLFSSLEFDKNYFINYFPSSLKLKTKYQYIISKYLKFTMNKNLNWKDNIKFSVNFFVDKKIF